MPLRALQNVALAGDHHRAVDRHAAAAVASSSKISLSFQGRTFFVGGRLQVIPSPAPMFDDQASIWRHHIYIFSTVVVIRHMVY